ncbi:MAG TPA: hypothetical protein VF912_09550 [Anaeromyxobacter sp.]
MRKLWLITLALAPFASMAALPQGGWVVEQVPTTGGLQGHPAIDVAIDSAGGTHVVVSREAGAAYLYRASARDAWAIEELGPGLGGVNIALDGQGRPHVLWTAWSPYVGLEMIYAAKLEDGTWQRTTIEQWPFKPSLAVDRAGVAHVVFSVSSPNWPEDLNYYVHHVVIDGGVVSDEVLGTGTSSSVTVDPQGRPHVAFTAGEGLGLNYGVADSGAWQITHMFDSYPLGMVSIAVDGAGVPSILVTGDNYLGFLLRSDGVTWSVTPISSFYVQMQGGLLEIDRFDRLQYVSFANPSTVDLRMMDGGVFTDSFVAAGQYALAMAVDPNSGLPQVGYYSDPQSTDPSLNLARYVADATPPTIQVAATPTVLWPPDGKMVPVTITGSAEDAETGIASMAITISDEYGIYNMTVPGFGSTVQLPASRDAMDRDGRAYTVTVVATDRAANHAQATTVVTVPFIL